MIVDNHGYQSFKIAKAREAGIIDFDFDKEFLDYALYLNNGNQTFELKSSGNFDQPLVVDLMGIAT